MAYRPQILTVANGGTGQTSLTAYAPLAGGTTTTGNLQNTSQLVYCVFGAAPVCSAAAGTAAVATSSNTNNLIFNDGNAFEIFNQTNVGQPAPTLSNNPVGSGLSFAAVINAGSLGIEMTNGHQANCKTNRTCNSSPAFFLKATFIITTDNLVNQLFIGFRKQQSYTATLTSYTDYATIGISGTNSPAKIQIQTQTGSGGQTTTNTTNTWASGATHTLGVFVDASGNVTYTIDGSAPTATAAFQFASGKNVIPFMWYVTPAGGSAEVDITSWIFGNQ